MKFSFDLTVGGQVIRIEDAAEDEKEFIEKMAFWNSIPKLGPKDESDLIFCYRTPQNKFKYYSVVSPGSGQEFKFGIQNNDRQNLFPKGWEKLQRATIHEHEEAPEREPEKQAPASDDINALAEAIVKLRQISKVEGGYEIKGSSANYRVTRPGQVLICNCRRYTEASRFNASFECEHKKAVRLFVEAQQKKPAQPMTATHGQLADTIASLEEKVNRKAIDAKIAAVTGGWFALDELDEADAAKALGALKQWRPEMDNQIGQRKTGGR